MFIACNDSPLLSIGKKAWFNSRLPSGFVFSLRSSRLFWSLAEMNCQNLCEIVLPSLITDWKIFYGHGKSWNVQERFLYQLHALSTSRFSYERNFLNWTKELYFKNWPQFHPSNPIIIITSTGFGKRGPHQLLSLVYIDDHAFFTNIHS